MAIWALIVIGAGGLVGPGSLWWLIPIAACTVFSRGGHRHHHREWSDEAPREELTRI